MSTHAPSIDRTALAALTAAGMLWGLTVPLSKLALGWLDPAWLTVARFALAAPVLAYVGRHGLRAALRPTVAAAGAIGFGVVIVLQNSGIARTSVSHAAVVIGTVPVLVALLSAAAGQVGASGPRGWAGYAIALGGIGLVAGSGGAGASTAGDLLVFASAGLSATFIVIQPRLLDGRNAAAVTAVQLAGGAALGLPLALLTPGAAPQLTPPIVPLLALLLLVVGGTVLPFWLFAYGQAKVPADLAGAYVNLEPVVGALIGWTAFGNTASPWQLAGAVAVMGGIALSTVPRGERRPDERRPRPGARVRCPAGSCPAAVPPQRC